MVHKTVITRGDIIIIIMENDIEQSYSRRAAARNVKDFFVEMIDTPGVAIDIAPDYSGVRLEASADVSDEDFEKLSAFCSAHDFGVTVQVLRVGIVEAQES